MLSRCPDDGEDFLGLYLQKYDVSSLAAPEEEIPPMAAKLMQNFPNPFNPETTLSFALPQASPVTIEVFNIKGQKVKTLIKDSFAPGQHSVVWNGTDDKGLSVSSGVYFYKMSTTNLVSTRKMLLMK